ncbi:MAG: hypothetical protein M0Z48_04435 [Nitrospiraceae bacterium]|nr:hypothetical protein [Nitrospiraceae bacterium]
MVDSPWFADRDIITFSPIGGQSISDMQSAFVSAFQDMGYPNAAVLAVDAGTASSQPGTVLPSAETALGGVFKPLTGEVNYLVIAAIIGLALFAYIESRK